MDRAFRASLLAAVVTTTAAAVPTSRPAPSESAGEEPAPPDTFSVATLAGLRLTGGPARIAIRYFDAEAAPQVEVAIAASDDAGRGWSALALVPPAFLGTLDAVVAVVDRPLRPGEAGVHLALPAGDEAFAASGSLAIRLRAGRLAGEASGMTDRFAARFEGPFIVSCAVPAAVATDGASAPRSDDAPAPLVVDDDFASALCRPHRRPG